MSRAAGFTFSYQEAGAIDVLGHAKGLPDAHSGHNGFSEWGRPPASDTHALLLGYDGPADAAPYFHGCRTLANIDDGVANYRETVVQTARRRRGVPSIHAARVISRTVPP